MANVIDTARPLVHGQVAVGLLGSAVTAIAERFAKLRDAYIAERRAQRLAYATRDLDQHLLQDIGLDQGAS